MQLIRDILGGADPYDVLVRCARTFIQTFIALIIAGGALALEVSAYQSAIVAATAAVLAVIHGYLAPGRVPPQVDVSASTGEAAWAKTVDDAHRSV